MEIPCMEVGWAWKEVEDNVVVVGGSSKEGTGREGEREEEVEWKENTCSFKMTWRETKIYREEGSYIL